MNMEVRVDFMRNLFRIVNSDIISSFLIKKRKVTVFNVTVAIMLSPTLKTSDAIRNNKHF